MTANRRCAGRSTAVSSCRFSRSSALRCLHGHLRQHSRFGAGIADDRPSGPVAPAAVRQALRCRPEERRQRCCCDLPDDDTCRGLTGSVQDRRQQDRQALYRLRQLRMWHRTERIEQLRSLLVGCGIAIAPGPGAVRKTILELRDDAENGPSFGFREPPRESRRPLGPSHAACCSSATFAS